MTDLKRITPEHAASLFERNGIDPIQRLTFGRQNGRVCGCIVFAIVADHDGLGAVQDRLAKGGVPVFHITSRAHELGYRQHYISGPMMGFDGEPMPTPHKMPAECLAGYEDGLAIRLRVLCEGGAA